MERKVKVAAYVRVSEQSTLTNHSLEAQRDYYDRMIRENITWEHAGIYVDRGISGTDMKKRKGFQRMMTDCEAGKIDRILVKSVSRFARNTVDLLKTVRKLKMQQIAVWFEEQQLDSMSEEGDLMLTLLASVAQAESESLSESIKWAVRTGFANGKANTKKRMLGYRWEKDIPVIVPEEAEVVKRIFAQYLAGVSCEKIARALDEDGIRSVNGRRIGVSSISYILRNITYTGNLLLQKTYVQDPITKKKVINTGAIPQYLVENNHEAVISTEIYEQVQKKLEANKKMKRFPYNRTGQKYPFTGKIVCGCCGRHYTRQLWNAGKNRPKVPTWVCTGKKNGKYRRCDGKNIQEKKLQEASARILGTEAFDEKRFEKMVERITVEENGKLRFVVREGKKQSE